MAKMEIKVINNFEMKGGRVDDRDWGYKKTIVLGIDSPFNSLIKRHHPSNAHEVNYGDEYTFIEFSHESGRKVNFVESDEVHMKGAQSHLPFIKDIIRAQLGVLIMDIEENMRDLKLIPHEGTFMDEDEEIRFKNEALEKLFKGELKIDMEDYKYHSTPMDILHDLAWEEFYKLRKEEEEETRPRIFPNSYMTELFGENWEEIEEFTPSLLTEKGKGEMKNILSFSVALNNYDAWEVNPEFISQFLEDAGDYFDDIIEDFMLLLIRSMNYVHRNFVN